MGETSLIEGKKRRIKRDNRGGKEKKGEIKSTSKKCCMEGNQNPCRIYLPLKSYI